MKQIYDREHLPPMPVLQIRLVTPEWELRTEPLQAIVDTGADGTLVPIKYLRHIKASVGGDRHS